MIFDWENWLWKSELCNFWINNLTEIQKINKKLLYYLLSCKDPISFGCWNLKFLKRNLQFLQREKVCPFFELLIALFWSLLFLLLNQFDHLWVYSYHQKWKNHFSAVFKYYPSAMLKVHSVGFSTFLAWFTKCCMQVNYPCCFMVL